MNNIIEKSIENVKATSCLTDDIDNILDYIGWLECLISFGVTGMFSGYACMKPEELKEDYNKSIGAIK